MAFATKKELMYAGILTLVFALIVVILALTLPLKQDVIQDQNTKDVNNFNPAYDGNTNAAAQQLKEDQNKAYIECVSRCNENKGTISYSNGPCLSDQFGFDVKGWACDIAHNPRIALDNDPLNQCKSYLNGETNRFVEVDENCAIIR